MEKDIEDIQEEEISEEKLSEEIYHSSDEYYWLKEEDENLRIGFTPTGAEVHDGIKTISIKPIGTYLNKDAAFAGYMGVIAGGLYMPISGTIIDLNFDLRRNPSLVNSDPEDSGWLIKVKPSKFEEEVEELEKVITEEAGPEDSAQEELEESSKKEIKEE